MDKCNTPHCKNVHSFFSYSLRFIECGHVVSFNLSNLFVFIFLKRGHSNLSVIMVLEWSHPKFAPPLATVKPQHPVTSLNGLSLFRLGYDFLICVLKCFEMWVSFLYLLTAFYFEFIFEIRKFWSCLCQPRINEWQLYVRQHFVSYKKNNWLLE